MTFEQPRRPHRCITDLKFDAWFAGELSAMPRSAIEDHLADCARCRARRAALERERQSFLRMRPHAPLQTRAAPARRSRFVFGGAVLCAAAVLALALRSKAPEPTAAFRLKGGPHIGFFVRRGAGSSRGSSEQIVHPGDSIQFVYTSERPVYLAIYSRAGGVVSVYFPSRADAQRVPGAYDAPLDSAVQLDSVLGPEEIVAVFCEKRFALEAPRALLSAGHELAPIPGCRVDTLTWVKEPMP